jgi:predicted nucleotidyltransferase
VDKSTVINNLKIYADLVCACFPVQKIILYGSYAKGTAREYSDIDVAVIVDKIDDILESEYKLYELRRDIDEMIEPLIFEANGDDLSGFLEEIQKTGEVIYSV